MTNQIKYFSRMLGALMLCAGLVMTSCVEKEPEPIAVESVTLDMNSAEMLVGDTLRLTATVSPSDAANQKVIWSTSDATVATVKNGLLSALKAGQVTVTAKSDDGGKTDECSITVKEKPGENNENEQGGNENNGGEQEKPKDPATLSLDKVTAATATFTGHLNVSASDLSFSQVTVYYSDAETFNMNAAESVAATSFDNDQNFTITLTNLKFGTKYNYCMVAEVKSEKTYGDVLNFTTEDIVLSLSVAPSNFTAEITGSVTGLSEVDSEYIKIGVLYSSDTGNVENGEGNKVKVTEISSDDSFSVSLADLTVDTKYYYCGYVCQSNSYTYGTPAEFTTLKHPYDIPQDLDIAAATDLSSSASANCYIVSEKGLYKFKAVKGNSTTSVGSVASASIIWETFGTSTAPEIFDLISSCCYKDDYIAFQTADTFKEGNAVIAAKDASNNILWSWHIWLTDEPQGQVYYNNAGTMMDRNLGATSATPGDVGALGLLYQWGRKDPFLGASKISNGSEAKSTITWPPAESSNSSRGTIQYTTAHPTTFIGYNESNSDWYYTGDETTDNTRWTTSETAKSIYDPCPIGWRVPDGDDNGVWAKALSFSEVTTSSLYDEINEGMNFSDQLGSDVCIWYPASGHRYFKDGKIYPDGVGYIGYYWSASPCRSESCESHAECLTINEFRGYISPADITGRAGGLSVRCIKE